MAESLRPADASVPFATSVAPEPTLPDLLGGLLRSALDTIHGLRAASVAVRASRGRRMERMGSTSTSIDDLDEIQFDSGGPCLEATSTGVEVIARLPDARWPVYSRAAEEAGYESVWSLPLSVGSATSGALNLYWAVAVPWETDIGRARVLAAHVAVTVGHARAAAELRERSDNLTRALETRTIIGQAQGVLMASEKISAAEAFDVLRRASQRTNRKLRVIAQEIVDRYDPPAPGP